MFCYWEEEMGLKKKIIIKEDNINEIKAIDIKKSIPKIGQSIVFMHDQHSGASNMAMSPIKKISLEYKVFQINFWESFDFVEKEKLLTIRPLTIFYKDGIKKSVLYGLKTEDDLRKHLNE